MLKAENISKRFAGIQALEKVQLHVEKGEIHGLVGENGAGKSTLTKILMGIYQPDEGNIFVAGHKVHFSSAFDARLAGIGCVHQNIDLAIVPSLSVAENLVLFTRTHERTQKWIRWNKLYEEAERILSCVNLALDLRLPAKYLTLPQKQLLAISREVFYRVKILIFDEPTSTLTEREKDILFSLIRSLSDQGTSIVYISHRLEEVLDLCARVTVLKDGRKVDTVEVSSLAMEELVQLILGKKRKEKYPAKEVKPRKTYFSVRGLSRDDGRISNIDFDLRESEILGVTGVMGAGKTELCKAIFGVYTKHTGKILLRGKEIRIPNPATAVKYGIGFLPEDRLEEGLVLNLRVRENVTLPLLPDLSKFGWIVRGEEVKITEEMIHNLDIATRGANEFVKYLSGGNQQKVVLAKWLAMSTQVLMLDEPTQGIDVGAKTEIYKLMIRFTGQGYGVIFCTSEIEEAVELCDRVLILNRGKIVCELPGGTNKDIVLYHATKEIPV